MLRDLRIDQFPKMGFEALVRPFLVSSHQTGVARHISSENGGEATDRGHLSRGGRLAYPNLP
jgi:hypothetical protein